MSTRRFQDDEDAYARWMAVHREEGYVFNHFGGNDPSYNVLHSAGCRTLHAEADRGRRTVVEKICSVDRAALVAVVDEVREGRGWKDCGTCGG